MKRIQLSPTTMIFVAVLVGAGAFAAGRSTSPAAPAAPASPEVASTSTSTSTTELPPGHPPVEGNAFAPAAASESDLAWQVPSRWQSVPSTSSMRLATYRIPHAPGDAEDPEVSVMQAGGTVDANAKRWIEQFDAEGQKTAKRSTRKVNGLEVTIVEVDGKYSGGMGAGAREQENWSLVGVIVATPGMPHFFKVTGPTKSVKAARAEVDELIGSLSTR